MKEFIHNLNFYVLILIKKIKKKKEKDSSNSKFMNLSSKLNFGKF